MSQHPSCSAGSLSALRLSMQIEENPASDQREGSASRFNLRFVLKACIFATGVAGIVAEYVMSTLATYLLGNAVLQWTLTISLMLFAMGLGSRLSKHIRTSLLDAFLLIEFVLSLICAVSVCLAYLLSAYIQNVAPVIYTLAFIIGVLIGLEIPLALRLNNFFEELRINVSSVMEKDYYGALVGGLLFAFFALPQLGLTYTPIALGTINFLVASVLFVRYRSLLKFRKGLTLGFVTVPILLVLVSLMAQPIILYGEQQKYRDRVIYQKQTPYQRIVMTQWKDDFWLYLDGNEQFSSYDEERYHEPLVHPSMGISASRKQILVLGGGDGLAAREILKYPEVERVVVVDIDPAVTALARSHPMFLRLNQGVLDDSRIEIVNRDAYAYLRDDSSRYDVIIIDLPDPKSANLARLYTVQFYRTAAQHLGPGGVLVTQATSPFFSKTAFLSILKSVRAAELVAVAYHNHIPTLGEWGWVVGIKAPGVEAAQLKRKLSRLTFDELPTRFLNQDAMVSMLNFGKGVMDQLEEISISEELDLAVHRYYREGAWDLY